MIQPHSPMLLMHSWSLTRGSYNNSRKVLDSRVL